MPYIKEEDRRKFDIVLENLPPFQNKGELEYLIFCLMRCYMVVRFNQYTNLHDCVYAAQHCADEFRRRYLDKREDEALEENGDI